MYGLNLRLFSLTLLKKHANSGYQFIPNFVFFDGLLFFEIIQKSVLLIHL